MKKIIECFDIEVTDVDRIRFYMKFTKGLTKYAVLIKKNSLYIVKPDAEHFTLKELQEAVEGYIEIVHSKIGGCVDVVNEEGLIKGLYINELAYLLAGQKYVGNVLICPEKLLEEPEE